MTDSTTKWHTFLESQGAQWNGNSLAGFDCAEDRRKPQLIPLEHQALLSVSGPDAEKFLQGQTTCDMRQIAAGKVLLGAHCDHKGRMHSSFTSAGITADDENETAIGLRLHGSIVETARLALQKYIVFSKAELKEAAPLRALAIIGAGAQRALQLLDHPLPEHDNTFTRQQHTTLLRHHTEHYELWLPAEQAMAVWQQLAQTAVPAAPAAWDLALIREGVGQVRAQTVGEFIPQMLNFQKLGGISFDKGCYTGQEVVARMHYLGKLKKHMYVAEADVSNIPAPGAGVYGAESDQPLGQVVMAAPVSATRCALLVVCSEQSAARDDLALRASGGAQITMQQLPYSLE